MSNRKIVSGLQSLLDRMTNDARTGLMFEADGDSLREAIAALRTADRVVFLCVKPACRADCCGCNCAISPEQQLKYAVRYAWLRSKNIDDMKRGGVFGGQVPENLALNGDDLDAAIDAERVAVTCGPARSRAAMSSTAK